MFPEEVEELIKEAGYPSLVSGNSHQARENRSKLSQNIKPSLRLTSLSKKTLVNLIESLNAGSKEIQEITTYLKETYGENSLSNQTTVFDAINSGLESEKRVIIFNFRNITHPQTRINIAGLIMEELFTRNKKQPSKRFLVLEEAHNFAPEKGFGDVSAGKENLSLTFARKIASEGRKFNLGLMVITQRPAQVSKYILSQLNTQVMFRTINASDIDTVSTFVEFAGSDIANILPKLPTGKGIVSGTGVPFPLLVEVV
ncbi:unknown protein (plasmid) [Aquifex aeolicus VF5]|uniref:ATP-binding protein n=1 Tax=Aquifex aeolicus (strain VF5) TaxID=224324 RepID=O66420_AQUAE|nr:unknown protein [Aquifex aeolicus VF5]